MATLDILSCAVLSNILMGKELKEELLALITTGDSILGKQDELFKNHGLSLEKHNQIITDGGPATVSKNRGLVSRIKNVAPKTNALHCLIHQSVLCAKLSGDLKEVMDKTTTIINSNMDQVVDILKQSTSKGATDHLHIIQDNVAFLADIFSHLNALNLQLHGKEKFVAEILERLDDFGNKLHLFCAYCFIREAAALHHTVHNGDVIEFVRDPFTISPGRVFSANVKKVKLLDERAIQSEQVGIQASNLKCQLELSTQITFWVVCPHGNGTLKTLAMYVLTTFESTCTCKYVFSKLNTIKTHERNPLSKQSFEYCLSRSCQVRSWCQRGNVISPINKMCVFQP
ncbi:hypothetical protein N1851_030513 [Merluccius polli]|uniref:Uncharacterized protein n=1 Tax=Merluccius polli TaxID=89951 RepID=A0AA47M566_MERPO|nr:hypothetical protein N1851_030513 [Merluccius polli]